MSLKAVTANRLSDGSVVWLGPKGTWVEQIAAAALFPAEEAEAALAQGKAAVAACYLVDPYLIDVVREGGRVRPLRYREVLRALGPSVRLDLGKQAEGSALLRKDVA